MTTYFLLDGEIWLYLCTVFFWCIFLCNYVIVSELKTILPSEIRWCFFLFKKTHKKKICVDLWQLLRECVYSVIDILWVYLFVCISYVCMCVSDNYIDSIWIINGINFCFLFSLRWDCLHLSVSFHIFDFI